MSESHIKENTTSTRFNCYGGITLAGKHPPVQATIDRSTLMLCRNLVDKKSTKEHEIIERQLAMKDHRSTSWVVHSSKELLTKYDLPSAFVQKKCSIPISA